MSRTDENGVPWWRTEIAKNARRRKNRERVIRWIADFAVALCIVAALILLAGWNL